MLCLAPSVCLCLQIFFHPLWISWLGSKFIGDSMKCYCKSATGIVLVEELVFRSWLPEEIEADFGYGQGVIISGLAFSLFQRSLVVIPGLWLLSVALSGMWQRNEGSLSIPIGLRAGIVSSIDFILK